jgi:hypothetical protein
MLHASRISRKDASTKEVPFFATWRHARTSPPVLPPPPGSFASRTPAIMSMPQAYRYSPGFLGVMLTVTGFSRGSFSFTPKSFITISVAQVFG